MRDVNKKICGYVLPSVASLLVTFLYIAVDGMFVGRGVGADALAAVNLALPFAALVTALADLVAMGGASVAAIRLGRNDARGAGEAASTSLFALVVLAVAVCLFGMFASAGIAATSGAVGRLLALTTEYVFYYSAFAVFVALGIALSALIRNDGRPGLAFWGMVAGAAANILLDWVFIFPLGMGIKGAAIASGLGQILTVAILLSHFVRRRGRLRLHPASIVPGLLGKVLVRGVPEFITQMSQPITVLCFNFVVLRELGETGVAAYAVVCSLTSLIFAVQTGVAGGMQPLFGGSYGERNRELTRYYRNAGILLNLAAAAALYLVLALAGKNIASLFNPEPALTEIAAHGLLLYGLAFIPASVNITATAFFLSTKRTGWAMLIAAARGCALNVLLILLVPTLVGGKALWTPLIAVEALTLALSVQLLKRAEKRRNPDSVILLPKPAA